VILEVFVPGKLTNPLNGSLSRAHWSHKHRWSTAWKAATWVETAKLWTGPGPTPTWTPEQPKRVTFMAHTARLFDETGLRAALKPAEDALMGWPQAHPTHWRLIHSDAPDSGHVFVYDQVIDRAQRGVRITIEPHPKGATA